MNEPHPTLFHERVAERICRHVLASEVTVATPEQIAHAEQLHALGRCPHTIVRDEAGWMYDYRWCVTCGKGLGTV